MTKLPDHIAIAQRESAARDNLQAMRFLAERINRATAALIDDARKDDVNWTMRVRIGLNDMAQIAETACRLRHGVLANASAAEIYKAFEDKTGPTLEELAEV